MLEVLYEITLRPIASSGSIRAATLFRAIEAFKPTLLLDEVDTYAKQDPELRGIINGSISKKMAETMRCVGDSHIPARFSTWCPKIMTGIGELHDTTADRSITIKLNRRALDGPPIRDLTALDESSASLKRLRRKILRWCQDNRQEIILGLSDVKFPVGIHDRAKDCWRAILAIAAQVGPEWEDKIFKACTKLTEGEDGAGLREALLADLKEIFLTGNDPEFIPTETLLEKLNTRDDRPWCEFSPGKKPLTAHGLSNQLKRFDIKSDKKRLPADQGGKPMRGYWLKDLKPTWTRYGSGTLEQPTKTLANSENQSGTILKNVPIVNSPKPSTSLDCSNVPNEDPFEDKIAVLDNF
ncbi:MAG: DUF3631 domain-containing protein [Sphingomonadales bacterium]